MTIATAASAPAATPKAGPAARKARAIGTAIAATSRGSFHGDTPGSLAGAIAVPSQPALVALADPLVRHNTLQHRDPHRSTSPLPFPCRRGATRPTRT